LPEVTAIPFRDYIDVRLRVANGRIPKLPEERATLIGGIVAPEQFATQLRIQADEKRFDKLRISFQQRHRVRRHLL